jgi:hypothetical protein
MNELAKRLASTRAARMLEAANRLAARMGCRFVPNARWPLIGGSAPTELEERK